MDPPFYFENPPSKRLGLRLRLGLCFVYNDTLRLNYFFIVVWIYTLYMYPALILHVINTELPC
jgi:hypothetical protein